MGSRVPLDGAAQAVHEWCRGVKAEQLLGRPAGIQLAARLAVGLGGVPGQPALEPGQASNGLGQPLDADPSVALRTCLEGAVVDWPRWVYDHELLSRSILAAMLTDLIFTRHPPLTDATRYRA